MGAGHGNAGYLNNCVKEATRYLEFEATEMNCICICISVVSVSTKRAKLPFHSSAGLGTSFKGDWIGATSEWLFLSIMFSFLPKQLDVRLIKAEHFPPVGAANSPLLCSQLLQLSRHAVCPYDHLLGCHCGSGSRQSHPNAIL
jgi:hypothetical protein